MSIWKIGRKEFRVEKRAITPRRHPTEKRKHEKPIDGLSPIAKEVSRALRGRPIRFPANWFNGE